MGRFQTPNLSYIRNDDDKYASAFSAQQQAIQNVADQVNADPTSTSNAPPSALSGFNVVAQNGIHDIQWMDNAPGNRGRNFFADYSTTPDFQSYHTIDAGASQNHRANLGPGQYYWRGYHAYSTSDHSTPVFHGGSAPVAVGSGAYSGPPMQAKQGSMGYGPIYSNSTTAPVRR